MIPEEVAEIAYILRERYNLEGEEEFDYSVQVAWEIYHLTQSYEKANLEGSY